MKTKQYRNKIAATIHETAEGLYASGLMDKKTMQEFDGSCLTPTKNLTAEEIRNIREKENVSQSVFANYLNVTKGLVSQWERGEKHPSGTSLKLLSLVAKKGLDAIA
ncbi:MAG: DNA-binding transcriptional regulator [Pseudomonadota bacterium]